MSSDADKTLSEGTMLDDKYRIERLLAAGSMGEVYLGTHTKLRKRVAIKILNPELSSASMIERFHREAITASQIGHEGIAQVTDIGTSREGEPFLVMEYLEGESLASRLRTLGRLEIEDACEMGCAILSPLSAAHQTGIVHRDLKPDNVFLVRQSRGEMVKLLDFGISRAPGLSSEFRLTSTGLVLGTPYYMSPEQARGESQITPAADLYAFGVILYEMLAGEVPIQADNYNQLMYKVMIGEFPRPREKRPELPEELERLILHAMAHHPADRPGSAAEIEQALLAFCRPVFREHVSGRIAVPALALKTPLLGDRTSDVSIDPRMFAGPTMSDRLPAESLPLPGDSSEVTSIKHGELTERGSHPVLVPTLLVPTLAAEDRTSFTYEAARPSLARWIPIGIAGAVAAGALVLVFALVFARGRETGGAPSTAVAPAPALPPPISPPPIDLPGGVPSESPVAPAVAPPAGSGGSAQVPEDKLAAPAPETITLRFAIDPPGAVITLDGARVTGPEMVVPKDTARHQLRITAAGYLGHDETISFDESQRLSFQLKRAASPPRGPDPPKVPPRVERIDSKSPYQ